MAVRTIDPSFHVTGQIKPSQLREIAGLGFAAVICMRPDGEGFMQPAFSEVADAAKDAGLEAYYLPVVPGAVSFEQARQLRELLAKQAGPVLAYCASGQRCAAAYDLSRNT